MGFLDPGGEWSSLASHFLSGQLLPGHLLSGGLACCLFCSGHFGKTKQSMNR